MSQFEGQNQWGQWSEIPEGTDPCIYPMHPKCLESKTNNQNQVTMDYSELKLTQADAKHFVLMMLAVMAAIWVMQKF